MQGYNLRLYTKAWHNQFSVYVLVGVGVAHVSCFLAKLMVVWNTILQSSTFVSVKSCTFALKCFRSYSLRPKTCTDHQNYNSCFFFQLLIVTFKRLEDSHTPNHNVFSFLMTKKKFSTSKSLRILNKLGKVRKSIRYLTGRTT